MFIYLKEINRDEIIKKKQKEKERIILIIFGNDYNFIKKGVIQNSQSRNGKYIMIRLFLIGDLFSIKKL